MKRDLLTIALFCAAKVFRYFLDREVDSAESKIRSATVHLGFVKHMRDLADQQSEQIAVLMEDVAPWVRTDAKRSASAN